MKHEIPFCGESKDKKKIIIIAGAAFVALIVAAGVLLYFWYPTTPVYALAETSRAIRIHDWDTFSRYVDVDTLSMELAKEITVAAYRVMDEKGIPPLVSKRLAVLYGTNVKKGLPSDLRAWVVNGAPPGASVLGSMMKGSGGVKPGLKGISWKAGAARAKIGFGKGSVLELELAKSNGTWRIIRIGNVRELYEKSKGKG